MARFLPLLVLAAVFAGCDATDSVLPDTSVFEGSYSGALSGTLRGRAHASVGTYGGESYQVLLDGTLPDRPMRTGSGITITRSYARSLPPGTYPVGGSIGPESVSLYVSLLDSTRAGVPRTLYFGKSGTLHVEEREGRTFGTLRAVAVPLDESSPGPHIVVEGRFEALVALPPDA